MLVPQPLRLSRLPRFLAAPAIAVFFFSCVSVEEVPDGTNGIPKPAPAVPVAGTDADGDGVRDDVQAWIQSAYPDPVVRSAARQLAVSLQAMLVNTSGESGALAAAAAMNAAIDCLYALDPAAFGGRVDAVEAAVVNTGNRARAYARAGAHLSGDVFTVSTVADNIASCGAAP